MYEEPLIEAITEDVARRTVSPAITWNNLPDANKRMAMNRVRPIIEALEEAGYLKAPEMRTYHVKIDDPDMKSAHEYDVEAVSAEAAAFEGARRACLEPDDHPLRPSSQKVGGDDRLIRESPGVIEGVAMYAWVTLAGETVLEGVH